MKWKKGNDWGAIFYECNGMRLAKTVSKVRVTLPSGTEQKCRLRRDEHRTQVSDHGNSYTVRSPRVMVCFDIGGLETAAEISELPSAVPVEWEAE